MQPLSHATSPLGQLKPPVPPDPVPLEPPLPVPLEPLLPVHCEDELAQVPSPQQTPLEQ
jgi:hypothetical protein